MVQRYRVGVQHHFTGRIILFRSPIILLSHDYILLISLEDRHGGVVALHRLVDFLPEAKLERVTG